MLSIKIAVVADIPIIRELTMQVWPQTYTPILGETQVSYMLDTMYNSQELERQILGTQQYLICYDGKQPVAFASYSPTGDGIYKLNKIYVLPGMQGRGVGKFILAHVLAEIKGKHAIALDLNVNKYNYSAKTFYEKLGFQLLKDEDIDIGAGYFMNDHVLRYYL